MIDQNEIIIKIKDVLKSLRYYVVNDGGDVEYVDFKDGILTLKITGACATCPFQDDTFDHGIKIVLLNEIPELKDVIFKI